MKKLIDPTVLRFLLVGTFNTLVGYGIMFLLYNAVGYSYWLSTAVNYVIVSAISFFLNKYFTFRNYEKSWRQAGRFMINIATCYLIAYGAAKRIVLYLLTGWPIRLQENAAMLIGMCIYTALNYIGQKLFAFRTVK